MRYAKEILIIFYIILLTCSCVHKSGQPMYTKNVVLHTLIVEEYGYDALYVETETPNVFAIRSNKYKMLVRVEYKDGKLIRLDRPIHLLRF